MVTGETKSFFSFAKSVSQRCSLLLSNEHFIANETYTRTNKNDSPAIDVLLCFFPSSGGRWRR